MLKEFYNNSVAYEEWQIAWPSPLRRMMPVSLLGLIFAATLASNFVYHIERTGLLMTSFTWIVIVLSATSHIIALLNTKNWVSDAVYQQLALSAYFVTLGAVALAVTLITRDVLFICGNVSFLLVLVCAALFYERPA